MNPPHFANYGNVPPYGYPGTYNQFNTYNSFGPSYYNNAQPSAFPPSITPGYGAPQAYSPQQNYSVPPPQPNPSPYNPYSNLPSSNIGLGTVTY